MTTDIDTLPPATLKSLIERGILRVMENQPIPQTIEETPEYRRHAHLRSQPIHISQAARDYGIDKRTISRWVKRGILKTLGTEKNRVLLDRAYMAYCAEVYRTRRGQGKWVFDENGLPYTPETRS